MFNARASIRLNKRSLKQLAFETLKKVTDQILEEDYRSVKMSYSKVSGVCYINKNKTWLVDVDKLEVGYLKEVMDSIEDSAIEPHSPKVVKIIPSKSGYHIITKPFNLKKWSELYPQYGVLDIHKDNPTNLFIP